MTPTAKRLAIYSAPLSMPMTVVAISKAVIWACGVYWDPEYVGSAIASCALIIAMPAGFAVIAFAHAEGWLK